MCVQGASTPGPAMECERILTHTHTRSDTPRYRLFFCAQICRDPCLQKACKTAKNSCDGGDMMTVCWSDSRSVTVSQLSPTWTSCHSNDDTPPPSLPPAPHPRSPPAPRCASSVAAVLIPVTAVLHIVRPLQIRVPRRGGGKAC